MGERHNRGEVFRNKFQLEKSHQSNGPPKEPRMRKKRLVGGRKTCVKKQKLKRLLRDELNPGRLNSVEEAGEMYPNATTAGKPAIK